MEPMNLGSPPSSPASPRTNFLPAFLMGDQTPVSPNPAISPGRNRTPQMKSQVYTNPANLRQRLLNQTNEYSPYNSPAVEKTGPPKQALFDTIEKNKPLSSTVAHEESSFFSPNETFSRIGCDTLNYSSNLNETRHIFQNQRPAERIDTLWVTVFGFIPSTTSLILTQMANCGTISDKRFPTQGNWIHLKFTSPHEVAKALLLNGRMLSNCIMIGVVPYYNKEGNKENLNNSTVYSSPVRARSLRNSTVIPHSPNSTLPSQNIPQKSTGIVTKAMEYVFGW